MFFSRKPQMTDLHCHIIPGMDDGPSEMSESIEMARIAYADGIRRIVATPHVHNTDATPQSIRNAADALSAELRAQRVDVEILAGADVNVSLDPQLLGGYTINGSRYILIEFPHSHLPGNAADYVFALRSKGYVPVVTHPERNGTVLNDPVAVEGLVQSGALVQLTADSIVGNFGRDIEYCAHHLIRRGLCHVIASDAHSAGRRAPAIYDAFRMAASITGKTRALRMVVDTPEAIVNDQEVPDE